jgi:hypothetical protein
MHLRAWPLGGILQAAGDAVEVTLALGGDLAALAVELALGLARAGSRGGGAE